MAELNPIQWWKRLIALPNTSPVKTLAVATLVSLTCAVIVSVTAVSLRPLQQANVEAERRARMEQMLASLPGLSDLILEAGAESVRPVLVDLEAGTVVEGADAASYDQRAAAADPEQSIEIPADADIAGLGRRPLLAPAYLVGSDGTLSLVVLAVNGAGYQSQLYGYLALEGDLNTIAGLTFYEQGDTPGLGSRIQDPAWEALWPGTQIADENGEISVAVVRGKASEPYEVDGISGATRTGNGVTNLLRFWLGDYGFGPFLERLANNEVVL